MILKSNYESLLSHSVSESALVCEIDIVLWVLGIFHRVSPVIMVVGI